MKKNKSNLNAYCISHKFYKNLDNMGLNIIGSGAYNKKFPSHWLKDSTGKKNISKKNLNYGSLTSIYWIWKNKINRINTNDYISFFHYRRFWLKEKHDKNITPNNLKKNVLKSIPIEYTKYDALMCNQIDLKGYKFSKLIKKGKRSFLKDPTILFNKKKHTINLHFDIFHINNGLIKAANLLEKKDRKDFIFYINNQTSFYPLSIFILKKKYFTKLCASTFKWLKKCEKIFNSKNLVGYGEIRIFDFLAERYFSYWISKHCKIKIWPHKHINVD